uniref:Uncharacterized protein n=1 Tax=Anopheles coluzzii TaxID=1518534 RepID=A0A8W7NZJ1_ANOCL
LFRHLLRECKTNRKFEQQHHELQADLSRRAGTDGCVPGPNRGSSVQKVPEESGRRRPTSSQCSPEGFAAGGGRKGSRWIMGPPSQLLVAFPPEGGEFSPPAPNRSRSLCNQFRHPTPTSTNWRGTVFTTTP